MKTLKDCLGNLAPNATISGFAGNYGNYAYYALSTVAEDVDVIKGTANQVLKAAKKLGFVITEEKKDGYGKPFYKATHTATEAALKEQQTKMDEKWANAETIFVRYGALPESGFSIDFSSGRKEKGVSVFEAKKIDDEILVTPKTNQQMASMLSVNDRELFVITGDVVGTGADGEPVLANAKIA